MNNSFVRCIVQRLGELLVPCAALSAMIYKLYLMGLIPDTYEGCFFGMLAGTAVFIGINVPLLRQCYAVIPEQREYYTANYIAYGIFAAINAAAHIALSKELYTWFFGITKFMCFARLGINIWMSSVIFHIIMIAVIPLARIGKKQGYEPKAHKRSSRVGKMIFYYTFGWIIDLIMRQREKRGTNGRRGRMISGMIGYYLFGIWLIDLLMGKRRR